MNQFISVSPDSRQPRTSARLCRGSFPPPVLRNAFTLIELLIVIVIIAILASLLTVGVNKAIQFSRQVGVKTEMAQIELALANAARELGSVPYIPSRIILRDRLDYDDPARVSPQPDDAASQRLLRMMFPGMPFLGELGYVVVDWGADGPGNMETLNADQAWVFFLGGIPSPPGSPPGTDGFNRGANPTVPLGKRKGPFYDFKPTRLKKLSNDFYIYFDSWEKNCLLVYNNISRDPSVVNDADWPPNPPGTDPRTRPPRPPRPPIEPDFPGRYFMASNKLFNPKGYQILSAGKDGIFGTTQARRNGSSTLMRIFNGYTDADTTGGADDQANFADSLLAKPVD